MRPNGDTTRKGCHWCYGSACAVSYSMGCMVRQVGKGFVHCIVGVSWEVWPHAMSIIVVGRATTGGGGRLTLTDTPKDLLVNCETNYASLKRMPNQASNVNGTGTHTHARADFISLSQYIPATELG